MPDFMTQPKTVKTLAASASMRMHAKRAKWYAHGLLCLAASILLMKARIYFNW